ncbi:GGDEF and EAL domain-containing protein [Bacillus sp. B1-b2]|uniref:sensor domain-containing protein n=1 Tax=Bacillus sp. B1-b2 TaxID=2653201 RepID=UPI0018697760|nr:GGDEF and EAL domain-containing protein [Bacillus sp. B1-b2]
MQKNSKAKWIITLCFFVICSFLVNLFHPDKSILLILHFMLDMAIIFTLIVIIKRIASMFSELSHSNKKLQSIFEATDIAIWFHDLRSNNLLITSGIEKIYGRSLEEFQSNISLWREVIHPDDLKIIQFREEHLREKNQEIISVYRIIKPDGKIRWIKDRGSAVFDVMTGEMMEFTSVLIDITDSKENEDKFSTLVDMSPDIIALIKDFHFLYINNAGSKILGSKTSYDLINRPISDFFSNETYEYIVDTFNKANETDNIMLDLELITLQKQKINLEISCMPILFGGQRTVLVFGRDVTSRKKADSMIKELAYKDTLTGLPNRNSCLDYLNEKLNKNEINSMSILFIDLDQFKRINDTKGHSTGDVILEKVADRLQSVLDEKDFVSRFGGDEFLILLENKTKEETTNISKVIIEEFATPIHVDEDEFFVTPSIGISLFPSDGTDQETLIKNADAAMYLAKDLGKNNYQFYSSYLAEKSSRKMELEMALRKAIKKKELSLFYQPQIDVKTGKISGVEALLRWKHPKYGYVSPGEFIPIAEETNLMFSIGEWVITEAFTQKKKWDECGAIHLKLAVNISAKQFQYNEFLHFLETEITRLQLDTANIELEITESVMQDIDSAKLILCRIKKLGFLISIDDFGKGYSSLSYLKSLPIDIIKIDKDFIDDIENPIHQGSLAKAIIDMGHNMHFSVIAEGVETKEQLKFLTIHQCDLIQGYYFSKPLPWNELELYYMEQMNKRS